MYTKVKSLVGENTMTLDDGAAIYKQIHGSLIEGETVALDFEGVEVFASPFFNAGAGHLLADLQPETLNERLKFDHLFDFGSRVLRRVIEIAKEYYESDPSRRNKIDRIVHGNAAVI